MANKINKITKNGVVYDIEDPNAATAAQLADEKTARENADGDLQTAINGKQAALTEAQLDAVNSGIDSTKVAQIATNASDIDSIEGKIPSVATAQNQLADKSYVDTADNGLQSQIDAISASSDVKDIVGTKAELNSYDTSTLGDNDIIKVLQDESENDATTYYRWSTSTNTFTLIGEEGPYYTKSQANALLDNKVDKVTGKGLSENDFTDADVTKLAGIEAGAEVNDIDSISVNGTAVTPDANKNVDITVPTPPTVVQTTGTSTTDVMSQNAVTEALASAGGGIKTLTSADYNYHRSGSEDDGVAPWLLSPGYYDATRINVYARGSNDLANALVSQFIVTQAHNDLGRTVLYLPSYGTNRVGFVHYNGSGVATDMDASQSGMGGILLGGDIVNSLTSTAADKPLAAIQGKVLKGLVDAKADKTAFTGTDGTAAGVMGLVPAPATTDAGKFLKADGSWGEAGGGGGITELTTEDYDYPTDNPDGVRLWAKPTGIYSLAPGIKVYGANNHVMTMPSAGGLGFVFNPGANQSKYVYYGGSGQLTYLEVNHIGNQATLMTVPITTSDPMAYRVDRALSAAAGYTLQQAIGTLSTLTTTAKTSTVAAINEVASRLINGGTTAPTTSTKGAVGTQYTYVDTTGTPTAHLCVCTEIDNTDPSNPVYTWQTLI